MKKFTLFFACLMTVTIFCLGQTEEELIYDNGTQTAWQGFSDVDDLGYAVRMTPEGPCQVLMLKYYMMKDGLSEGGFLATIYSWDGSAPAVTADYEQGSFVVFDNEWKEHDVIGTQNYDGDFVVGWVPIDPAAFLGVDEDLQTGRNWTLNHESGIWTEETGRTFLIRAVVQYTTGLTEELEGIPISVYPNPVTDIVNIEAEMKVNRVSILNTLGKEVYFEQLDQKAAQIDLSKYQPGIYFVRMEADGKTTTKKIVVK
jgi:hypothetical protein